MVTTQGLFETHLTVVNLERATKFYGQVLGLELATQIDEPRVAFYWLGGHGKSMLGLWEVGAAPQRLSLHIALAASLGDVLDGPRRLREMQIQPLDFARNPTEEAVVIGWMPAAAVYFRDPDGNLLEFLAMLPEKPRPEVGVVPWSRWNTPSR